jgi:hypothetical protein
MPTQFEVRINGSEGPANVLVTEEGEHWRVDGITAEPLLLPNDLQSLGEIVEVISGVVERVWGE